MLGLMRDGFYWFLGAIVTSVLDRMRDGKSSETDIWDSLSFLTTKHFRCAQPSHIHLLPIWIIVERCPVMIGLLVEACNSSPGAHSFSPLCVASNRNQARPSASSTQFSIRLAVAISPCSTHSSC